MRHNPHNHAYCYPNGHIEYALRTPQGAHAIAVGEPAILRRRIEATAERGNGGACFVPGMKLAHQAGHSRESFIALARYITQLSEYNGAGFRVVGQ